MNKGIVISPSVLDEQSLMNYACMEFIYLTMYLFSSGNVYTIYCDYVMLQYLLKTRTWKNRMWGKGGM